MRPFGLHASCAMTVGTSLHRSANTQTGAWRVTHDRRPSHLPAGPPSRRPDPPWRDRSRPPHRRPARHCRATASAQLCHQPVRPGSVRVRPSGAAVSAGCSAFGGRTLADSRQETPPSRVAARKNAADHGACCRSRDESMSCVCDCRRVMQPVRRNKAAE